MAAVVTLTKHVSLGDTEKLYWGKIAFDSSYPSGGELIAIPGVEKIDVLIAQGLSGYGFEWYESGQKLVATRTDQVDDPEEQVPDTMDLASLTAIPFIAIGS
jgi:hypothetical protein